MPWLALLCMRRMAGMDSLDMFGTVGGTVVFFVCNEGGEAAEFDVAQPAEASVSVLQGGEGRFGHG